MTELVLEQNYFSKNQIVKSSKVNVRQHKLDSKFKFLSGTDKWVQFDITEDSGFQKSIHYFSDRHSLEGNCPKILNCKTTTRSIPRRGGLRKRNQYSEISPCYDLLYFLEKMFDDAYNNKVYMDLFLEYPYNLLKIENATSGLIIKDSYLHMVYDKFQNCFTLQKKNCKYSPYVRVHYTDLRLTYNVLNRVVSSTSIVIDIMDDFLSTLDPYTLPNKEEFIQSFVFLDELFKFNFENGYSIFEILMTKDDYDKDIIDFYVPFKLKIKNLKTNLISKYEQYISDLLTLFKKRNNKKIFIAKHQIDELRKDNITFNGKNIADLITKNILDTRKVVKDQFESEINQSWKTVIRKYNNLIRDWNNMNFRLFALSFDQTIEDFFQIAVAIDAIMLDAYILPRVFRKFRAHPSTLTFVLAGSGHIQFEVDFFKNVLGVEPLHEIYRIEGSKQCLYYKDFWKVFDIKNYENSGKIKYYQFLTTQKIKDILKQREIKGVSKKNKEQLIAILRDDDKLVRESPNYDNYTIRELIQELKKRNITKYSGKKKKELIEMLL